MKDRYGKHYFEAEFYVADCTQVNWNVVWLVFSQGSNFCFICKHLKAHKNCQVKSCTVLKNIRLMNI